MLSLPPDIAFENAIQDLKEKFTALKKLAASIMVRRDETAVEVEAARGELQQLTAALAATVANDQDNEALALLQKKHDTETRLAALVTGLEQAEADVEAAKASLVEIEHGIERLAVERPRAVSAAAGVSLTEQLDGVGVEAELVALENAREQIKNTIAMVDLNRELSGAEPPTPREDPEVRARRQLEELKRSRRAGKNPGSPKKL